MKKSFALLLALMMVLSLAACGGEDRLPPGSEDNAPSSSQQTGQDTPDPGTDEPDDKGGSDTSQPTGEKTATEYLEDFDLAAIEIPVDKVSYITDYTAIRDENSVEILFSGIEADEFSAIAQSVFNALSAKGEVADNYGNVIASYEEAVGELDDNYYGYEAAGYEVSVSYYTEEFYSYKAQDMKLSISIE